MMNKLNYLLKSKLIKTLFMGFLFLTGYGLQAQWQPVGTVGFSAGLAFSTTLALDAAGTPFVAYRDNANGDKATVMKFDGANWVDVGSPGFSLGAAK